ncbi:phosphoribosylformylglycinamidine synthase [Eubacteriales bacterium OttesenSCG-928-N14]|nr:phosphoribosylformylglycinamidine synthase [Eubacteriales bacterium OttesenSCG-928-N14]
MKPCKRCTLEGDLVANEIKRLYVEKKPGFAVEAGNLKAKLQNDLGLTLEDLRLFNRYDIQGLYGEDYLIARDSIFREVNVDDVYEMDLPALEGYRIFAMEYLPGQYDQRADSAAQCVQLLTGKERPQVLTAKVIALKADLSKLQYETIISYLINPIEMRQADLAMPDSLSPQIEPPGPVPILHGFTAYDARQMQAFMDENDYTLTMADMLHCQRYFRDEEQRDPTETELKAIDTYWSDHCRHTTFLTHLDEIVPGEGAFSDTYRAALDLYEQTRSKVYAGREAKPVTLMDLGTIGAKAIKQSGGLTDLDESKEINACSIKYDVTIDGEQVPYLIQFKNETHNHPTEIEPFGGAATCLGGAIRDVLAGRGYVYHAMRVSGSGDPRTPIDQTLPGKLPQRTITTGATHGFSFYGNLIGLTTGQVYEIYDPGYVAKRMEVGAVVGACPEDAVRRMEPEDGDVVVLLGGRTGRDGIGGATGSSTAHDDTSLATMGSQVQKGNPPTERAIQRMLRNEEVSKMIKRCNDFGAGGVSVAIGELADGVDINLDAVPVKYAGLDGTELAISESQERMAMVLNAKDVQRFLQLADAENLEATPVATITDNRRLSMHFKGQTVVDISRDFLDTNGVMQHARAQLNDVDLLGNHRQQVPEQLHHKEIKSAWLDNLSRLEVASQHGMAEWFDGTIGAGTVLMPQSGKYQLTAEEAMVSKVSLLAGETDDCTAMAFGYNPGIAKFSPMHAGAFAVVESLTKLACAGVDALAARLSFQEYFERLENDPKRWGKPTAALLGALEAQLQLGVPSIGGKDSMSGSFGDLHVPPTLISFALAMSKASKTISAAIAQPGLQLALLRVPVRQSGLPDYAGVKNMLQRMHALIESGSIVHAAAVKEGGVAATISRMLLGNGMGAALHGNIDETTWFAPQVGNAVVAYTGEFDALFGDLDAIYLGETNAAAAVQIGDAVLDLEQIQQAWTQPLSGIFPTDAKAQPYMAQVPLTTTRSTGKPRIRVAKPRVMIPVFPGTNCEYDSARAFALAGGVPEVLVMNNLTPAGVEDTIMRMEKAIANSQMIMIPGGFSGGDEPDGSGKFIATVFRNARLMDAIHDLLQNRDGLMLGICNGFQALIKLGLVPYGQITQTQPDDPTLTYNAIGRHISRIAYTKVVSVQSPWMAGVQAGDVHAIPISHGEGRFVANIETVERLIANGQVATQYVTPDGQVVQGTQGNPNGSVCAIEGIFSPDGRVFGKMGHSERRGKDVIKNVPGNKDQHIFESGVRYFG